MEQRNDENRVFSVRHAVAAFQTSSIRPFIAGARMVVACVAVGLRVCRTVFLLGDVSGGGGGHASDESAAVHFEVWMAAPGCKVAVPRQHVLWKYDAGWH